ncbi:hypothetical protein Ddye_014262 [Dipteronia dyeriana]|uniref:RNase H type-1 domain-containing protein n=1 Tax=Dipteronia dyeriana TaxID=168575 RepID=A0AAD9X7L3_9ROSI|nr:hypothetical protein Ddye_014262 [Dipteronia dyeriana]
MLNRYGVSLNTCLSCPLCNEMEESVDHLFMNCSWSWKVWALGMGWWGGQWCAPNSIKEWADEYVSLCTVHESKRAWSTLFFATGWTIWEFLNRKVFNNEEPALYVALYSIWFRVVRWFKHYGCGSLDPLTSLLQCGHVMEIVSVSLVAVTWINSDTIGSFAHINLVYDIRDMLKSHGSMTVRFCSRLSNSYADSLAKKGSNKGMLFIGVVPDLGGWRKLNPQSYGIGVRYM